MFFGSTAGISILGKLLRAEEKVLEKVATRMRKEIATKKVSEIQMYFRDFYFVVVPVGLEPTTL